MSPCFLTHSPTHPLNLADRPVRPATPAPDSVIPAARSPDILAPPNVRSWLRMPSTPFRKPRHSLEAFDKLFERAFAPREPPSLAPLSLSDDTRRSAIPSPPSPSTPFYSPVDPNFPISPQEASLDPIWEEVMLTKERELATAPSKVKSLEGSMSQAQSHQSSSQTHTIGQGQGPGYGKKRVTKRRSR